MNLVLKLLRGVLDAARKTVDEIPCANPVQVNLMYGDERRGDCLERKSTTHGGPPLCRRCELRHALALSNEHAMFMERDDWPAEWPEWRNKK